MLIGAWQPAARAAARTHAPPAGALCGLDPCTGPAGGACGWGRAPPPMAEAAVGDYAIMQGAFVHPAGSAFAAERTLHFLERNQIAERVSGFLLMEHQTGPPLKG